MNKKNILAIDTFSSILSVALMSNGNLHYTEINEGLKHSELVMDCIDSQMKTAGLKPGDLDGVLCMGGPGSFTGLRIGYSIAKGLALSLSIPFAPVPTLECISLPPPPSSPSSPSSPPSSPLPPRSPRLCVSARDSCQLAVIEARKNACFYAFFRGGSRLTPDKDGDYSQIAGEIERFGEEITLTGPGSALLYDFLPLELKKTTILKNENKGYAKELILVAQNRNILDNVNNEYLYSGPEYIRMTDAEIDLLEKNGK